jgi:hypothetical protein
MVDGGGQHRRGRAGGRCAALSRAAVDKKERKRTHGVLHLQPYNLGHATYNLQPVY